MSANKIRSNWIWWIIVSLLLTTILLTRTVGLDWGLPYPFHPDERNMVEAVMRLSCEDTFNGGSGATQFLEQLKTCMNPEFWAYGQPPLYLAFGMVKIWHVVSGLFVNGSAGDIVSSGTVNGITFTQAAMALRILSVLATLGALWLIVKIVQRIGRRVFAVGPLSTRMQAIVALVVAGFHPYMVQYAHFGTTESILMFLYLGVVWKGLDILEDLNLRNVIVGAALVGLATSVKISALILGLVLGGAIIWKLYKNGTSGLRLVQGVARYGLLSLGIAFVVFGITSPQSLLHWRDFLGSMTYELGVGGGSLRVFYTRQFEYTIPIIYQFAKILPYALCPLGLLLFIFGMTGLFGLGWRSSAHRDLNFVRIALIVTFIPAAFVYTKWARFIAPVMPLMSVVGIVFLLRLFEVVFKRVSSDVLRKVIVAVVLIILSVPGIAYTSVYLGQDVRFQASEWLLENVEPGSNVVIETGNVINLPVYSEELRIRSAENPDYRRDFNVIPVDLYNIDTSLQLQQEFELTIEDADYIVIASRRVFANHTCQLPQDYSDLRTDLEFNVPVLSSIISGKWPGWCQDKQNDYPFVGAFFGRLFNQAESGGPGAGFEHVATFSDYPRIELGMSESGLVKLFEIEDELAEEAWTVFDHPVVRVYSR